MIIYGQNIGTCITAVLASLNGDRSSKRLSAIHILINVLGTITFCNLSKIYPTSFIHRILDSKLYDANCLYAYFL